MYTIQVDNTFQQIIQLFYRIGIWQSDQESYYHKVGRKSIYTVYAALFPIFFAFNAVLCADRNESIFSVQILIITSVVYLKFLYLMFKQKEILGFFFDEVVVHAIENREEFQHTNEKIKKFMKFVRPYCWSFFISATLIISSKLPMISSDKGLPFFMSFSYNDSEIIYWLAYLFLSVSDIFYAILNLFTPFIWYTMLNYSIEYELLGNKLRDFGVEKTVENQQKSVELAQRSVYVEDFISLIKAHRNLTKTVERFRSCFSTLFMGQITTCGIVICTSVYSLAFASNQNIFQIQLNLITLFYGLFDILLVTYLANEVTVASDRLSYCLFESNWLEQTESCKGYLLIMGEVLKQPQRLVILVYQMNLETFMTIINGAYRMFHVLKNFR